MMQDEFRVFKKQEDLKSEMIEYYLALIRKKINMVKEIKERTL